MQKGESFDILWEFFSHLRSDVVHLFIPCTTDVDICEINQRELHHPKKDAVPFVLYPISFTPFWDNTSHNTLRLLEQIHH